MSDFILREFTAEQKKLLGDIDYKMYEFHDKGNTVCIAGGYMDEGREAQDVDFIVELRDDESEFLSYLIDTLEEVGFVSTEEPLFGDTPKINIEATPKQYRDNTINTNVGIIRAKHKEFGDLECQFIIRKADIFEVINNFPISLQQVAQTVGVKALYKTGMFDFSLQRKLVLVTKECNPRYLKKYKGYYPEYTFSQELPKPKEVF